MKQICDLQIHSKYSRAVSRDMDLKHIHSWAVRKGIDIVATGDWTHPLWFREIKANLEDNGKGLFRLKGTSDKEGPLFLLATEVSSIYSQGGKVRRIHNLIWSPDIATCEKIIRNLTGQGANLMSDGRPITGLSSIEIARTVFEVNSQALLIPAHAWTPWFSLYGSQSGFDSIDECFGKFAGNIFAVETGLSSNPAMNWRIGELDGRRILSFSDAHSGAKLGREATVFDLEDLSFGSIRSAITKDTQGEKSKILYTVEFYPEEGKYHYSGHRKCQVKQTPNETKSKGPLCHVCGKKLTIGVMHRVEDLATRSEEELGLYKDKLEGTEIEAIYSKTFSKRPPFVMFVPLAEIISESLNVGVSSKKVQNEYALITEAFQGEFNVLLKADIDKISQITSEKIAQGINKVRKGEIFVDPGYDGEFGKVKIWDDENDKAEEKKQMSFF